MNEGQKVARCRRWIRNTATEPMKNRSQRVDDLLLITIIQGTYSYHVFTSKVANQNDLILELSNFMLLTED